MKVYSGPSGSNNYLGAALFISYILFALYFTFKVCASLFSLHRSLNPSSRSHSLYKEKLSLLVSASLLSFAVLSYNMLDFLITSYFSWLQRQPLITVPNISSAGDLITVEKSIWRWMTDTPLFLHFAKELFSTPESTTVSLLYLASAFSANLYMARKGSYDPP